MASYIALKPIQVGDGIRQPGELVPEAADWPDVRPWIGGGFVKEITDEEAARVSDPGSDPGPKKKKPAKVEATIEPAPAPAELEPQPEPPSPATTQEPK